MKHIYVVLEENHTMTCKVNEIEVEDGDFVNTLRCEHRQTNHITCPICDNSK